MSTFAKTIGVTVIGGVALYFAPWGVDRKKTLLPVDPLAESSLVKVAFVFRHGDRAPLFPMSPGSSFNTAWPDGFGELTKVGKKNAYLLGKRLRQRYDAILTPHYSKDNLYATSTQMERTLMTAYLVLAGLYPPTNHQKWHDDISWTPIPVYPNPFYTKEKCQYACPRFLYEVLSLFKIQKNEDCEPLMNHVTTHTGYKFAQPENPWKELILVYDHTFLKKRHGLEMKDWENEFLSLGASTFNRVYQSLTVMTSVQKQLSSSLMSDYFLAFLADPHRVSVFSAHDLNLYMISGSLGYEVTSPPLPTACVTVEVHDKKGVKSIKAFYYEEATGSLKPLKMSCGLECPYNEFVAMLHKVKPSDYDALCHEVPSDIDLNSNPAMSGLVKALSPP